MGTNEGNTRDKFGQKRLMILLGVAFLAILVIYGGYTYVRISNENKVIAAKIINPVVIPSSLQVMIHDGEYTHAGFTYKVRVTIKNEAITNIEILQNKTTKQAKAAEGVIARVIQRNNTDVDVIAGATASSKALLLAIVDSFYGSDC
ncbi:MAG: FMN-binding protein [bacterium]|nr:FMN-binding protein [bacterium]